MDLTYFEIISLGEMDELHFFITFLFFHFIRVISRGLFLIILANPPTFFVIYQAVTEFPGVKSNFTMQEIIQFSKVISFDCHGEWKRGNIEFNPKGFYSSYNATLDDNCGGANYEINLFGKKFDFWSAFQTDCDWLFSVCSSFLMDLHNLEISSHQKKNLSKQNLMDMEKQAMCSRTEISRLLYYTDYYLKICLTKRNDLSMEDFMKLESNLNSLRADFQHVAKFFLTDEVLMHCSLGEDKMFPCTSYHLIHCWLDFQWYYILIKYKINEIKYLWNDQPGRFENYSKKTDPFLVLMIELVLTSIIKYKWAKESKSLEDMFTCPCIKELWVLLFKHLGLEAFWDYFNQVLSAVLDIKSPPDNEALKTLCILSSRHLRDKLEDKEFTIHFLRTIAKLKDHIICKLDYPLNTGRFIPFFDNVRQYLNSSPSEKSLREMFRAIGFIMNDWELEKERVIVLMWEYLYKHLDLPFHVPGVKPKGKKMSGKSFLIEIKNRFLPNEEPDEDEDSFGLFLRIMAIQVQKKRSQGYGMKNFYSRIYLKYDILKKFHRYKELALYRTSSLFLTAAIAYGIEKETKKLRDLMIARKSDGLSEEEKVVKWKTLVACLLLLAENGCSVREITIDIITEIRFALWEKDVTLIAIFVECIQVVIENRNNYLSALSIICMFIDEWMENFLELSSGNERGSFLSIFDPLIEDLRNGPEWWSLEDAEGIEKQLCTHILPAVKRYLHSSTARTAAMFLSYFIKARKCAQSYSLYNIWLHSKDLDTSITRKFITSFYDIEGNINKLGHCVADYDVDIIQTFIREQLLNEQTHGSYQLKKIVQSLPKITRYTADIRYDWSEDHALDGFIRLFGLILNKCLLPSEKANIKELFNKCLSKFEVWIEIGLTTKTKSVVNNIYRCSGLITSECHSIVYEVNRPCLLRTIVNKVFLPVKKGRNLYELPSVFINAACEHLPLFIRGLLRLIKRDNSCIRNMLLGVLEFSFPTDPYFTEDFFKKHSFYKCLLEPEITVQFTILLQDIFFSRQHKTSNAQTENVIRLFSFISSPSARDNIFSSCVHRLLHLIMELDYSCKMLKCVLDYIEKCTRESHNCRNNLAAALEEIVETELSACSENIGKLLRHLRVVCPREISGLGMIVKQQMEEAEKSNNIRKLSYLKTFERDLKNTLV